MYVEGYNNGQHAKGGLIYLEIIPWKRLIIAGKEMLDSWW